MTKYLLLLFFSVFMFQPDSKAVEVPSEIEFGGMQLKLTEGVKKLLQADIDMITRGQKAFQTKVDRADLYFPIIEKIFAEENLPDDFKYLSLQESSLVSDAVSSSQAVGYWQFKKESAIEVGLRVDHHVDERMNIVSSTRGAARYLKRNNAALQNWIYALLSYNLGLGGVKSRVEDKYVGAKKMVIDKDMHWYVIRFLAHKLAYENAVGKNTNPSMHLLVYDQCTDKSLHEIARETEVNEDDLKMYNKWLKKHSVPSDKKYFVILPVNGEEKQKLIARNMVVDDYAGTNTGATVSNNKDNYVVTITIPDVKEKKDKKKVKAQVSLSESSTVPLFTSVNKIKAIKAKEGDSPAKLASAAGIAVEDFLRYNDMKSFEKVEAGKIYYLQPKRGKATVIFHTVQAGEDLRTISQMYGVKINSIRSKNRMDKSESLQPGRVLWLKDKRPKDKPVEYKPVVSQERTVDVKPEKQNEIKPVEKDSVSENIESIPEKVTQPVSIKTDSSKVRIHEVKAGETLFAINRLYGTSIDSIMAWNNMQGYDLKIGQKLIVEKKIVENNESKAISHQVAQGETLYSISRKYGVSVEEIKKWNNKTDNIVSIGEVLVIKKGAE